MADTAGLKVDTLEGHLKETRERASEEAREEFEKKFGSQLGFLPEETKKGIKEKYASLKSESQEQGNEKELLQKAIQEYFQTQNHISPQDKSELQQKINEVLEKDENEKGVDDIPELVTLKRLVDEGHMKSRFKYEEFKRTLEGKTAAEVDEAIKTAIENECNDADEKKKTTQNLYGEEKVDENTYAKSDFFKDIAGKQQAQSLGMQEANTYNLFLANRYISVKTKDGKQNVERDISDLMDRSLKDFLEECSKDFKQKHGAEIEAIKSEKDFTKKYSSFKKLFELRQSENGFQAKNIQQRTGDKGEKEKTDIKAILKKAQEGNKDTQDSKQKIPQITSKIEEIENLLPTLNGAQKEKAQAVIKQAQEALKSPSTEKMEEAISALESVLNSYKT